MLLVNASFNSGNLESIRQGMWSNYRAISSTIDFFYLDMDDPNLSLLTSFNCYISCTNKLESYTTSCKLSINSYNEALNLICSSSEAVNKFNIETITANSVIFLLNPVIG